MENFLIELLGENTIDVWAAGFIWVIVAIALVKAWFYPTEQKFNIWFWLKDNSREIVIGIIASLIFMRLGDAGVQLLKKHWEQMPETTDMVVLMMFVSAIIQYKLHKKKRKE